MVSFKEKYYATMRQKLGVDTDEGVRAWLKEQANKSKRNPTGVGGFGDMDKARHKEVSSLGGKNKKK